MATQLRALMAADPAAVERASLSSCVTESDVKTFVENAFREPLEFAGPLTTIPKATLVVGAGKLERSKYDDELPKWVTTALRDLKFVDDRGASALPACAGSYKYQHDTGKNEKFVHVFPFVKIMANDDNEAESEEPSMTTGIEKAKWMCIESTPAIFKEMVQAKMGTWTTKRRALALLKEKDEILEQVELKLTNRVALSPEEQKLFDATDRNSVEEKMQHLRSEMVKMVDEDKLTKQERAMALEQIKSKIAELEANGGAKNLESVKARAEAVEKRLQDKGNRIPLKNEEKMKQLWRKTLPLEKLVEKAGPKGRWNTALTPTEVKALGDKEDWEAEIQAMADASRFWFEEDDELAARVASGRALIAGSIKGSKPSSSATSKPAAATSRPMGSAGGSAWSTVGKPAARPSASAATKKPGKSTNAFAGLGDDSDSD
jgi:hypothetical protein